MSKKNVNSTKQTLKAENNNAKKILGILVSLLGLSVIGTIVADIISGSLQKSFSVFNNEYWIYGLVSLFFLLGTFSIGTLLIICGIKLFKNKKILKVVLIVASLLLIMYVASRLLDLQGMILYAPETLDINNTITENSIDENYFIVTSINETIKGVIIAASAFVVGIITTLLVTFKTPKE